MVSLASFCVLLSRGVQPEMHRVIKHCQVSACKPCSWSLLIYPGPATCLRWDQCVFVEAAGMEFVTSVIACL